MERGHDNTPPTGDPHRGEDPTEDPPPEGMATQGNHSEHTQTDAFRFGADAVAGEQKTD